MHDMLGRNYAGGRYGLIETCTTGAIFRQVGAALTGNEMTNCQANDVYDNDFFRLVSQFGMSVASSFSNEQEKNSRIAFARIDYSSFIPSSLESDSFEMA